MTAPTSKSKTKNYRLLTVGALRPHIIVAAYIFNIGCVNINFCRAPRLCGRSAPTVKSL